MTRQDMTELLLDSADMLQRVYGRRTAYNNKAALAQSWFWTSGKLM
jgi:hypothetical protein